MTTAYMSDGTKHRSGLKTYTGIVCARYYQEVTVEAESQEEAEQIMCSQFDIGNADSDGVDVYDTKEADNAPR